MPGRLRIEGLEQRELLTADMGITVPTAEFEQVAGDDGGVSDLDMPDTIIWELDGGNVGSTDGTVREVSDDGGDDDIIDVDDVIIWDIDGGNAGDPATENRSGSGIGGGGEWISNHNVPMIVVR